MSSNRDRNSRTLASKSTTSCRSPPFLVQTQPPTLLVFEKSIAEAARIRSSWHVPVISNMEGEGIHPISDFKTRYYPMNSNRCQAACALRGAIDLREALCEYFSYTQAH
jgi:hypothetical protein